MIEELILTIQGAHRERCFMMEQRKRSHLALAAFLRRREGWHPDLPEKERKAISAQALEMAEGVEPDHPAYRFIQAANAARQPFIDAEAENTKIMEKAAKKLPVWEFWGKDIRGFGARSLAVIVGEAGDLSNYPDESKLWKRMGLAVIDGVRQGGLKKTASADQWIAHGYNATRRAQMFVIGDVLVKQGEVYREIYLARKEYERERAAADGLIVLPSAKIPKGQEHLHLSDGHVHKRAQRYMEKRFLKDLWKAWRRTTVLMSEKTNQRVSSAEELRAAA